VGGPEPRDATSMPAVASVLCAGEGGMASSCRRCTPLQAAIAGKSARSAKPAGRCPEGTRPPASPMCAARSYARAHDRPKPAREPLAEHGADVLRGARVKISPTWGTTDFDTGPWARLCTHIDSATRGRGRRALPHQGRATMFSPNPYGGRLARRGFLRPKRWRNERPGIALRDTLREGPRRTMGVARAATTASCNGPTMA